MLIRVSFHAPIALSISKWSLGRQVVNSLELGLTLKVSMETSAAQAHGALRKMSLRDPEGMEHVPGAGELTTYFSGPLHMPQEQRKIGIQ